MIWPFKRKRAYTLPSTHGPLDDREREEKGLSVHHDSIHEDPNLDEVTVLSVPARNSQPRQQAAHPSVSRGRESYIPRAGTEYHPTSIESRGINRYRPVSRDYGTLPTHRVADDRYRSMRSVSDQPTRNLVTVEGRSQHDHSYSRRTRSQSHREQSRTHERYPPDQDRELKGVIRDFIYSRCTGRKKALCIGINYEGQRSELKGCINDAKNTYHFLLNNWGFKAEDMAILRDDSEDPRQHPTRKNILNAMRWLVKDASPHDSLFFHYSGHGAQVPDQDGDEIDGEDEVIFPVDFKTTDIIIDDEIHDILVKPLPRGCRLTALFDSCHSGSVLDLDCIYRPDGRLDTNQVAPAFRAQKWSNADVICWSGCKDSETSADTNEYGLAVGAMSYAFITSLTRKPKQSYEGLLASLRDILYRRFKQKPQLSSSHKIDTSLQFII